MRLEPQKRFPITRDLDPNDTDTNYVRALVYHLKTDNTQTLLSTVDLTDNGNQRFFKYWRIKAQQADEGDWVKIETRVYTDLGYTTLNESYVAEVNLHLVKREMKFGGGGGGASVDYGRIKEMIVDVIKKFKPGRPKVTVNPTPVSVKLNPVTEVLSKIIEAIKNNNEITKEQKEELAKLTEQVKGDFETTNKSIAALPKPPSLKPMKAALKSDTKKTAEALKTLENYNKAIVDIRAIHGRLDLLWQIFSAAKKNFEFVKVAALQVELQKRDKELAGQLKPLFDLAEKLDFLYGQDQQQR